MASALACFAALAVTGTVFSSPLQRQDPVDGGLQFDLVVSGHFHVAA
jgi:hypothetical protein